MFVSKTKVSYLHCTRKCPTLISQPKKQDWISQPEPEKYIIDRIHSDVAHITPTLNLHNKPHFLGNFRSKNSEQLAISFKMF